MPDVKLGIVDRSVLVFIPDPASTDGSGKTGLVAASLTVSYTRMETDNDAVVTDVTSSLNNLAALTSAHNDWGVLEVSSTLAPGLYRLDIADAVFASGAWYAVVYVMITTSAAAASPILFTLVAFDPLDGVRFGLTALPNAAADAAGGLVISDAGGLDADAQRADVAAILVDTGEIGAAGAGLTNINLPNQTMDIVGSITGNLSGSVGSVTGAVGSVTGSVGSVAAGGIAAASFAAGAIDAAAIATDAIDADALATDAVNEIVDQVWEEAIADHDGTAGSTAEALSAAATGSSPSAVADAVWDEARAGHVGAGSFGEGVIVETNSDKTGYALTAAYDAAKTAAQAGDAMTLTVGERNAVAAALLDLANGIETGVTLRQAQRLELAALAGKLSGAATTTVTFRNAVADSKNRIVATVDADGNRTAITTDLT